MLPLHTILHGTDFSDPSDHAFQLACALARDYAARLIVVHVAVTPAVIYGDGMVLPDLESYHEELQDKLNHLQALGGVALDRRLLSGDPVTEILRVARESGADLIVLGTHGRTRLNRLLMGSVAEMVVRRAPCPVLTVKMPVPEAVAVEGVPEVQPATP